MIIVTLLFFGAIFLLFGKNGVLAVITLFGLMIVNKIIDNPIVLSVLVGISTLVSGCCLCLIAAQQAGLFPEQAHVWRYVMGVGIVCTIASSVFFLEGRRLYRVR